MSDYIERQKAVEALDGKVIVTGHKNADAVLQYMKDISNKIKALPSADVVQVAHGRWKKQYRYQVNSICSVCGNEVGRCTRYCPNCGAKMDAQRGE